VNASVNVSSRALRRLRSSGQAPRGICFLSLVTLASCSWFTDFKQQPKIDPWESPADTIPFRGNPQGSVSIYGSAAPGFIYDRSPMGLPATSPFNALQNPTPADSASVDRGRVQFQINCAVCHGPMGQGNGPATKYGMAGINIAEGSAAAGYSDGYIFGMIRNGRVMMPPYNRIEEPDRWDVVNYIRALQKKVAVRADTTHGLPGQTGTLLPGASVDAPTRPAPYYRPEKRP
jgi:mono/diheme cytochrome c family protein